ncbi:MAG: NlpC/P60 family protein [Coriobacteriia bacterium]|nr:NlpC/P60 family protein [Coriobacteriia bacterium]
MRTPLPHMLKSLCVVVVATALFSSAAHATPETDRIEAVRQQVTAAEAELDELQAQLELRSEEYHVVSAQLSEVRSQAEETRRRLEQSDADLAETMSRLEDRAADIYRTGPVSLIEVMMGTTSFTDFLTRVDWMRRVSASDAALVAEVKRTREEVRQHRDALDRREEELAVLRTQAKTAREQVDSALRNQALYVRDLETEVAELIRVEEERRAREAEEARRRAEEAAHAALRAAASASTRVGRIDSVGPGRSDVVAVALPFVGVVEYVWGGATPAGFDCSGLTMYSYRQVGITIPRNSQMQFRSGSHIARDRLDLLAPGDLVFFGYGGDDRRVHHVGIYVGNGDYLHAPRRGEKVTISSLTERIATKGDYVGASRF